MHSEIDAMGTDLANHYKRQAIFLGWIEYEYFLMIIRQFWKFWRFPAISQGTQNFKRQQLLNGGNLIFI